MKKKRNLLLVLVVVIAVIVLSVGGVLAFRPKEHNEALDLSPTSSIPTTAITKTTTIPTTSPTTTVKTEAPSTTIQVTTPPTSSHTTPPTTTPSTTTPPLPTIDLSKWAAESYAPMSDEYYSLPNWNISADKKSVLEYSNCQPALFLSDFLVMNSRIHVKIKPMTTSELDDDYFGFAMGVQPGDTTNHQASYLLIDWKNSIPGEELYKDFIGGGPGGLAKIGLAVSQVNGIPTPDEFWQHVDDTQVSPQGEGLTELSRATTLGNTGWTFDHEYDFSFEFTKTSLNVYIDGSLEITIAGNFTNGKLAFYNFSQGGVNYKVS
jgi:hypothetical protein